MLLAVILGWFFFLAFGILVQISATEKTDSFILGYAAGFPIYVVASLFITWGLS